MTDVIFNFEEYYSKDFVDPMFAQYQNRKHYFDPFTTNANELRNGKNFFKKQFSILPCPTGMQRMKNNPDYCEPMKKNIPLFYEREGTFKNFLRKEPCFVNANIYE